MSLTSTSLYKWSRLVKSALAFVHRYSRPLSFISIGIFLVLMGWRLIVDWHSLPEDFYAQIDLIPALASVVILIPAMLLVSTRWWLTLRLIRVHVNWQGAVQSWFLSQAGRYLPGGVWPYLGRFLLSRGEVGDAPLVTGMVLETVLRVISEILVFLVTLPFWSQIIPLGVHYIFPLIIICGISLFILHPTVLNRCVRIPLVRYSGLSSIEVTYLRYGGLLVLLLYYVLTVVIVGSAFYLLIVAFYPLPVRFLPAICGALSLAMVVGFLVLFVPNGWGVREGVLALLLAQLMPPAVAILLAGVARLWLTVGEGIWILGMLGHRAMLKSYGALNAVRK